MSSLSGPWNILWIVSIATTVTPQPGVVPPILRIVRPEKPSVIRSQYDDAEFICHLTHFPPKTKVTWLFTDTNMTSRRIAEGIQAVNPKYELSPPEPLDPSSYTFVHTLHISRINMADDGNYVCSAYFNGSILLPPRLYNDSKRLIVRVAVEIHATQHNVEAVLNEQALLTWKVIGHPKPPLTRFHILLEGHTINRNLERYTILSNNLSKSVVTISLHIAWVKREDFGLYTLTYVNRLNRVVSALILLREIIRPTTTSKPTTTIPTTTTSTTTMSTSTTTIPATTAWYTPSATPVIHRITYPRHSPLSFITQTVTSQSSSPTARSTTDDIKDDRFKDNDDQHGSWNVEKSLIFAGAGAAIATVVITAIVALVVWHKRRHKGHHKRNPIYVDTVVNGRPSLHRQKSGVMDHPAPFSRSLHNKELNRYSLLHVDRYEFPRQRLRILDQVGQGKFGQIILGEALNIFGDGKWTQVAVKMAKDTATDYEKEDIRRELEIMKIYPRHTNVVTLLGCCIREDPALIIMEYLPHGNLQDYLRRSRPNSGETVEDELTAKDLTQFAWQVGRGMAHISAHNIIHRDLAARNILVGNNRVCKVSDFGLARNVAGTDHYERISKGPLPVRWMAPETFHDAYYTTKSDVWAYGTLLWEIVTLGASPYPGLTAEEVMKFVLSDQVMAKPPHCDDELYNIMCRCWCNTSDNRPSFTLITEMLEALLESEEDYIELKDYEETDYLYIASSSKEKC